MINIVHLGLIGFDLNYYPMKRKTNNKPKQEDSEESSNKKQKEYIELEIEENFFVKTLDHDRKRLEKWKFGRRNFP